METPHNRSQHWSCAEPLSLPIAVATAAASPVFFLLLLPPVWALVFSWPRWGPKTPWLPWGMSMWQMLRAWLLLTVLLVLVYLFCSCTCPIGLYFQNTSSKIKLLIISSWSPQSISQAWGPSESEALYNYRVHILKSVQVPDPICDTSNPLAWTIYSGRPNDIPGVTDEKRCDVGQVPMGKLQCQLLGFGSRAMLSTAGIMHLLKNGFKCTEPW